MKWMRERDALIAQTMAFVQSVTGRTGDFRHAEQSPAAPGSEPVLGTLAALEYALETRQSASDASIQSTPPRDIDPPPPKLAAEVAAEVRDRIEGFRKHQERFRREREEYFTSTLAKVRDAIHAIPPARREK